MYQQIIFELLSLNIKYICISSFPLLYPIRKDVYVCSKNLLQSSWEMEKKKEINNNK